MANAAMSPPGEVEVKMEINQANSIPALTPPTSENTDKKDDESGSELSDLEPEEFPEDHRVHPDIKVEEEIIPDHYYEGGKVPVFKPVSMLQALDGSRPCYTTGPRFSHHADLLQDDESISQFQRFHSEN